MGGQCTKKNKIDSDSLLYGNSLIQLFYTDTLSGLAKNICIQKDEDKINVIQETEGRSAYKDSMIDVYLEKSMDYKNDTITYVVDTIPSTLLKKNVNIQINKIGMAILKKNMFLCGNHLLGLKTKILPKRYSEISKDEFDRKLITYTQKYLSSIK